MTVDSPDYLERVYAGVLGKTIGVMMGKPVEGWDYERIVERFGQIRGYVHDELGYPLVCTDDDTSGTFTFVRALEGVGLREVRPKDIADAWLNYLIENRSVLWWGGIGASTEHTAYLRLKSGVPAPLSGSAVLNGKRVSEQIGAQIFIDSWAMLCPGDPELAADLARRAASVSHDGEAIYGAQVIAAMEALAFVESDIDRLVSTALSLIPADSLVAQVVRDVREWASDRSWQETRRKVAECYGAQEYGVGHMIPNHALIHLALWHGKGDFPESLSIVNTCGWDTDCNSGNLGCLLGIRDGLAGIPDDLRHPIADRMYLPTADSGRGITDCLRETVSLVGLVTPCVPKDGARFHFSLPGSVQGFTGDAQVSNPEGKGLIVRHSEGVTKVATPTFTPPDLGDMHGYELMASPTIYPGQRLLARWTANPPGDVRVAFLLRAHGADGCPREILSQWFEEPELEWTVPDLEGNPIYEVGLAIGGGPTDLCLDRLTWDGPPDVDLLRGTLGEMSRRVWVEAIDSLHLRPGVLSLVQNNELGMALCGCREWQDYIFEATLTPRTGGRFGIAISVQGLRRYLSLLLDTAGHARLVARYDEPVVLAQSTLDIKIDRPTNLRLWRDGNRLQAEVDGRHFGASVGEGRLETGGIAILCGQCRVDVTSAKIRGKYA